MIHFRKKASGGQLDVSEVFSHNQHSKYVFFILAKIKKLLIVRKVET